jgi:hypothetical protein
MKILKLRLHTILQSLCIIYFQILVRNANIINLDKGKYEQKLKKPYLSPGGERGSVDGITIRPRRGTYNFIMNSKI